MPWKIMAAEPKDGFDRGGVAPGEKVNNKIEHNDCEKREEKASQNNITKVEGDFFFVMTTPNGLGVETKVDRGHTHGNEDKDFG